MYEGLFTGDYKLKFEQAVYDLIAIDMPIEYRITHVEMLTDAYIEQTDKKPDSYLLSLLSDYILKDDLSNKHADKVSATEYPFLSKDQTSLRAKREMLILEDSRVPTNHKHKLQGKRKGVSRTEINAAQDNNLT